NPHFIFNALNSIQSMINEKDHRNARYQLAKFSKLMRATLEHSREALIPLEEEITALNNYLSIEQMSRNNSFEFSITTQGDTDSETLLVPPMMIQPFVENAILHGVAHIAHPGLIEVFFTRRNGFLECIVQDNGIGRQKASELKSQVAHQHKSAALQVTQERLAILNGPLSKSLQHLEISDRRSEEGVVVGTKVLLRLPINDF
ncbi:MAG: histidine kinase, partial [Bacteroidota bacterium]